MNTERRYDIDWLRVIAIALLLIYHAAIVFQPWGVLIGFIQSQKSIESLWIPMSILNVWRIPLLFFVSGMGVCFAIRKRSWKQLLLERSQRILLPFIFGVIAIVPVHELLWKGYYNQELTYTMSRGHLWFLGNIFCYVVLLIPVFFYLKRKANGRLGSMLAKVLSHPLGIFVVAIPFTMEVMLVNPEAFEVYAMTWHGFYLGLLAFLLGFLLIYVGQSVWNNLFQWLWMYLCLATVLFLVRLLVFDLQAPNYLLPLESMAWIYAVFGFAYKYLNRPSGLLTYLSGAAYPVYILHMIFLYMAAMWILPMGIHVQLQFVLVTILSLMASMLVYEILIRRIRWVGFLFGYKIN
ncbi:acyltransferase [Carboxylicivirga sp. M1479]|nr:acyltransferase [Carboxylicivirga sp. M1479]